MSDNTVRVLAMQEDMIRQQAEKIAALKKCYLIECDNHASTRKRLLAAQEEIAALKKSVEYWASHAPTDEYVNQLLAAQHRIKVLREALYMVAKFGRQYTSPEHPVIVAAMKALSTPDNTSKIDQLILDAQSWRNLENKMKEPK